MLVLDLQFHCRKRVKLDQARDRIRAGQKMMEVDRIVTIFLRKFIIKNEELLSNIGRNVFAVVLL